MEFLKRTFFIVERVTRSKRFWFLFILLFFILSSAGQESSSDYPLSQKEEKREYKLLNGSADSTNRILSVPINGIIMDESMTDNPLAYLQQPMTYGQEVREILDRAAKDNSIKAILLEINSPGGTVTGSKAISDAVTYYKSKTKKPVYAYISEQGLSGGYWSAASADYIVANEGGLVGSIGVILGPFKQYKQVTSESEGTTSISTKDGIETYYITGGKYKDTGNPYRAMTEDETKHWQSLVNDSYSMFTQHIATNRNLSDTYVQDTIKALPYHSQKAKELKLIDEVESRDFIIKQILTKTKLKETDYQIIQQKNSLSFFSDFFSALNRIAQPKATATCQLCGKQLFLYDPGYDFVF